MDIKIGSKIKLIAMIDEKDPIPTGSIGEVTSVTKLYESFILGIKWQNSDRQLNVVLPEDQIELLNE
jgi:hypothetical protein